MSDVAKLSSFVDEVIGGGTPPRNIPGYWSGNIPWASVKDLSESSLALIDTQEHISSAGLTNSAASLIPAGTPIVCTRMAVGRCAVPTVDVAINQDLKAFFPNAGTHKRFLAHSLSYLQPRLDAVATGSTVKGISLRHLLSFELYKPKLSEQRRIAEILDAIDEMIRLKGGLIAKLGQVKQGLINDALTLGVSDWRRSNAGSEFDIKPGITLGPERIPQRNPMPYLRVANVQRGFIDNSDIAILETYSGDSSNYALAAGDLLVVEGHANPWQIGRCAIVEDCHAGLLYQNHLFRLRARKILPRFGLLWLNSMFSQNYWWRTCATSSGLNTINSRQLSALTVLVPDEREQARIVGLAEGILSRLSAEQRELDKLRLLKRGLMHDLLTGRVRVGA